MFHIFLTIFWDMLFCDYVSNEKKEQVNSILFQNVHVEICILFIHFFKS